MCRLSLSCASAVRVKLPARCRVGGLDFRAARCTAGCGSPGGSQPEPEPRPRGWSCLVLSTCRDFRRGLPLHGVSPIRTIDRITRLVIAYLQISAMNLQPRALDRISICDAVLDVLCKLTARNPRSNSVTSPSHPISVGFPLEHYETKHVVEGLFNARLLSCEELRELSNEAAAVVELDVRPSPGCEIVT